MPRNGSQSSACQRWPSIQCGFAGVTGVTTLKRPNGSGARTPGSRTSEGRTNSLVVDMINSSLFLYMVGILAGSPPTLTLRAERSRRPRRPHRPPSATVRALRLPATPARRRRHPQLSPPSQRRGGLQLRAEPAKPTRAPHRDRPLAAIAEGSSKPQQSSHNRNSTTRSPVSTAPMRSPADR